MSFSRRALIHGVGRAGGIAAAYRTMAAMGLLPVPAAYVGPPALPNGAGRRVIVVGAGIAGLVLGYELAASGFDPLILEARGRAGGRNWTLRAGDLIEETDSAQRVRFNVAEHLYFNPGPARIPYHHEAILSYCRTLGVPLEVMCNDNRGALMQDDKAFGGAPQLNRRVVNDARGYVAELAAKATQRAALDQPASAADAERLRAFLRAFGALDRDLVYRGSSRAGWAEPPGVGEGGRANPPLDFQAILASEFWQGPMQWGELANMAPTMLQPIGGMGRIGAAFGRKLWGRITYNAEVTALRRTETGGRVVWKDASGAEQAAEAPVVVVTMPLSVLRAIPNDFAPPIREAIAASDYVSAGKVAFQAERRFWELDCGIYGGISWTSRPITQISVPHGRASAEKGRARRRLYVVAEGGRGVRRQASRAAAGRRARRWRGSASAIPHLARTRDHSRLAQDALQPGRLGGMERGGPRAPLRGAARWRRAVPVRRRASVLDQWVAGRGGAFGACGAERNRGASAGLMDGECGRGNT